MGMFATNQLIGWLGKHLDTVTVLCDLNVAQNVHVAQVPVGGEPYKLNMILKRILNCEEISVCLQS